jgi:RNA polymerase sigma-70 factor (ECF subfamily)
VAGPREHEDWAGVADRLLAGDRGAFLKVSRLIGSLLVRWRAYDFRDEWPDLIQDVLLAVLTGLRAGRVRDSGALVGYVAAIARHKLADRLRILGAGAAPDRVWAQAEDSPGGDWLEPSVERVVEMRLLLEKLPEPQRTVVFGVYGEGKTYEAVSRESGIPLGTLKRYLRDALAALRREFAE